MEEQPKKERRTQALTSTGRAKYRNGNCFTLVVTITFTKEEAAKTLISEWEKLADWCYENEPTLYHYEISESDKEPLRYLIYECYRTKNDYLTTHKSSDAFITFRAILKKMQDDGVAIVSGHSYNEMGVGFF